MILVVEASRTGCYFSWLTRGTAGILNPQITRSHLQYSRLKRCLRFSSSHYTFSPNLFPSVQNLPHIGHFLIFIWLNFGLKMLAELFIYGWSGICSFNLIFLTPPPPSPLCSNNFLGHNQGDKARVIQTLLFVAGINTLLQALFGTRLPAVVGGSFAYVIPIAYIVNDSQLQRINNPHEVSCPIFPFYKKILGSLRTTWK